MARGRDNRRVRQADSGDQNPGLQPSAFSFLALGLKLIASTRISPGWSERSWLLPVPSVIAPCHPGAVLRTPLHNRRGQTSSWTHLERSMRLYCRTFILGFVLGMATITAPRRDAEAQKRVERAVAT